MYSWYRGNQKAGKWNKNYMGQAPTNKMYYNFFSKDHRINFICKFRIDFISRLRIYFLPDLEFTFLADS